MVLAHFSPWRMEWTVISGSKRAIGFVRLACTAAFALLILSVGGTSSQGQDQRGTTIIHQDGESAVANGKYYALVIGIDDYPSPLPRLKTAVGDARAVSRVLSERYGFQVQLLLDRDATRAHILDAMTRYRNTLSPNDNLLIYYAGHGYSDHEAGKAYWLPADADSKFSANRIIADDLTTGVRVLPARHVLVISDSCYAGDLTRDVDGPSQSGGQAAFINRMLRSRSRTLMASGGDEPVSDAGTNGHSVFANALLGALERTDGQMFTASDMFYGSVRRLVGGHSKQMPEYSIIRDSSDDQGDFVFERKPTAEHAPHEELKSEQPNKSVEPTETAGSGNVAGGGTTEGSEKARKYENAALAGSATAMRELGLLYESGVGVNQDYDKARHWFEKGAEHGDSEAMDQLGGLYALGQGVVQNYPEARKWFEKSAAAGNAQAMNNLGWSYYMGYGGARDEQQARQWYEKAVVAGNTSAMCNLGALYVETEQPDYEQGRKWFEKGAAAGDAGCMRALGMVYEGGEGVTVDLAEARNWYEKAAAGGDEYASKRLKTMPK
jgi:TPR repeat protein